MRTIPARLPWFYRAVALLLAIQVATPPRALAAGPAIAAVAVQSAYDGNGNVVTRTDGNGAVTAFTYDNVNRLTAIDYPGGSSPDVSFTYDVNGNRTAMTDATGTTEYGYDLYDRLTGVGYPDGGFVTYGYDAVGNVTTLRYGNTKTATLSGGYTEIAYTFDEDNRIKTVKDVFANTLTSYTYDDAGHPLRRTLPNGVTTDYGYDGDGRLTSVDHKKSGGARICKYDYTLNAIGNRTKVIETLPDGVTKTTGYTYDPLDRLASATYPDGRAVTYVYDSFGNRLKMTEVTGATTKVTDYVYDNDSRLLSTKVNGAADETFSYDATGNLIQRVRASDNRQIDYAYDFENRLVRYFDGVNNLQYVYDGTGNRVARIANGARRGFVNDLNRDHVQVLAETDPSGNAARNLIWGTELISQMDVNVKAYYLTDTLNGSVRRVLSAGAADLNQYDYDAFGALIAKVEAAPNDYQFDSESQEDDAAGLLFLRARFYLPDLGRFLTRDPANSELKNPSSRNPYVFALNNPVTRRDPEGLASEPDTFSNRFKNELNRIYEPSKEIVSGAFELAESHEAAVGYLALGGVAAKSYSANGLFAGRIAIAGVDLAATAAASVTYVAVGSTIVGAGISAAVKPYEDSILSAFGYTWPQYVLDKAAAKNNVGTYNFLTTPSWQELNGFDLPGGVALNKSASVQLDINNITGGTYDAATGQIILFGTKDTSANALPKVNLDDLAVAVRAKQLGTFPVVSIEDPIVSNPPGLPSGQYGTVRYGPFYQDPLDGQTKVLDVSSKTHFGWVMFEADRQLKSLVLGVDNRRTSEPVSSSVPGYHNMVDLQEQYHVLNGDGRFWFEPKEIVVQPSSDGKSMQITKAEMQLSTEAAYASGGQTEGTPDAQYFATWFTNNYDAIAEEQVTLDAAGQPHKIYKELKQLAYIAGVVKWIDDNHIPVDLTFLQNYKAALYPEAPFVTPRTTVSKRINYGGGVSVTYTCTGGVTFCNDLVIGTGGNPSGLGAAAVTARPAETSLGWTFSSGGNSYNATAFSMDRTQKDGGMSPAAVDAQFQVNGAMPLMLGRYFNSSNVTQSPFGWGWQPQPYALEFKGNREMFSICHQTWNGYGELWFVDRAARGAYKFVPAGVYDRSADPQHLAPRFAAGKDILVYSFESKSTPGLLFSDNSTRMTMRLDSGVLLDFNFDGLLTQVEDRNGNKIAYGYDTNKRLTSISQPSGKSITLSYDVQNRIQSAALPDSRTVAYTYDSNSNLVSAQVAAPNGWIARYAYDANHNLTQLQDESGQAAATQTLDVYGRVTGISQPGVTTPFTEAYDLATRTSQANGPEGTSRTTVFNADNDPISFTDARSKTTTMTYNSHRDLTSIRTPDNQTRQMYVDAAGHRVATVMPNGRADIAFYDGFGHPTSTFHGPVDATFNSAFDAEHLYLDAGLNAYPTDSTQYSYDARGNRTGITDANSHTRLFAYDARGNLTSSKDGRGKETLLTYDNSSRLTKTQNPLGHAVSSTYDTHDNLTQLATAAGTVDYTYNAKNQVTAMTTGNAGARHTYNYTYDAKGHLATVTDPGNFVTQYTYDPRGNLTEIKHDGVVRFTYEYDGLNRLSRTRYAGTAGGARQTLVPTAPAGAEQLSTGSPIVIKWFIQGDWSSAPNVTLQYSTNGSTWTDIAIVPAANGSYTWNGAPASDTLRIRFVHTGDSSFRVTATAPFAVFAVAKYYVNDNSTAGDQYCTAVGKAYNSTTATGRTPADPVNDPQAILNNYTLHPGDTIYVDTGNYALNHDIVWTEADGGTPTRPVTMQGPTTGAGAVLTRVASASPNNAMFDIYDTNPGDATPLQGISVQNLKITKAARGIWLQDASYCTLRQNECYDNTRPGVAAGESGLGSGIVAGGGGHHVIESNKCYRNGGAGAAGTAATPNGGSGSGYGIYVEANDNIIRFNECWANGAMGGAAGTASAFAGNSIGGGIGVIGNATRLTGNEISDNICRDTTMTGLSSTISDSGWAVNSGIRVEYADDTKVLRNTIYGLLANGGNATTREGGLGQCVGIRAVDAGTLVVSGNRMADLRGNGGSAGTSNASLKNGEADAAGIYLQSTPNALVTNNLAYDCYAICFPKRGQEQAGEPYAGGLFVGLSSGCRILHNTFIQSRPSFTTSAAITELSGQFYLFSDSSNCVVENNIGISTDPYFPVVSLDDSSRVGLTLDYNDFHAPGGSVGAIGYTRYASLALWRTASGLDAHSVSIDPGFYDVANHNYHLISGSPLLDAGTTLADVPIDGDGESRPARGAAAVAAFDIGYDEFVDADGDTLADIIETKVTLTNPNDRDTDHDDLPDDWEVAYGLKPNDATGVYGKGGDPDGDGFTNRQEYLGHSNPKLASSVPAQPPTIASASPAESNPFILEGDSLAFTASATSATGGAVAYAWKVNGVLQSSTSGFTFTTNDESSGATTLNQAYAVELRVSSGGLEAVRTWTVTVGNRNRPPVLQTLSNVEAHPGDTVQFTPVYSDPDNGNAVTGDDNELTVTYSGFMTTSSKVLTAADVGSHTVTVTVRDNGTPSLTAQQTVTVNVLSDGTATEHIKPTVTLIKPATNGKVSGASAQITGLAKDETAVDSVDVTLNGEVVATLTPAAPGTKSFTYSANLIPEQGLNELRIQAFDAQGNASNPVTRKFTFVHVRPELAGTYNGLVTAEAGASPLGYHGLIKVTVAAAGTFSVQITLSGVTISSTGVFMNDGTARFGPKRTATLPLSKKVGRVVTPLGDLDLQVDLAGGKVITGKVAMAAGTLATIPHADLAIYSATNKAPVSIFDPATDKGKYTALFKPGADPNNGLTLERYPQGIGFAATTVSATGAVRLVGKSADNQNISYGNSLTSSNALPIFIGLNGNLAFLTGSAVFDSTKPESDARDAVMRWFKPAGLPNQTSYPNGWPDGILVDFTASKYLAPKAPITFTALGAGVPPAANTATASVEVTLRHAGFDSPFPRTQGSINAASKVTLIAPVNPASLTVAFTPATGVFSGRFLHPISGKSLTISGYVHQKTNSAGGFFIYTPPPVAGQKFPALSGRAVVTKAE